MKQPKAISFEDAQAIYDHLQRLEDDVQFRLDHTTRTTQKELYNALLVVRDSVRKIGNDVYTASHEEAPTKPLPKLGDIVIYDMGDMWERPAIITYVWEDGSVNLCIFPDGNFGSDHNILVTHTNIWKKL